MRFKPNPDGIQDLAQSAGVRVHLDRLADSVKERVEAESSSFARTGAYSRSIRTTKAERTIDGARVTVYSADPFAHLIEWGSAKNTAYAPLRRATSGLGMRFKEHGR